MAKRMFLIVLDSLGIGEMPDAADYGDVGSDTLGALYRSGDLRIPTMESWGIWNIDGIRGGAPVAAPLASYARLAEASSGKDTTTGHWEIAGLISRKAMPTYPDGFPPQVLDRLREATGREILCNKPYSGTDVIRDFGEEQMRTGALIVYTSADSVLQIAAHEAVILVEELYRICETARGIMQGEHGVGRIIARPFVGEPGSFVRTTNRHDYSLEPPGDTLCDLLAKAGLDVVGVGKITDIFAGRGVTRTIRTNGNGEGMAVTTELASQDFHGLCFINLVDFDMLYGHRNNVSGYTAALNEFDRWLAGFAALLGPEDAVLLTADHGCDPSTPSTDHSREYVPMLLWGAGIHRGVNLGTRQSFADIAATVQEYFALPVQTEGESFLPNVIL